MGAQLGTVGLGNLLAAQIAVASEDWGEKTAFFGIAIFSACVGVIVLIFKKQLEYWTHGADENNVLLNLDPRSRTLSQMSHTSEPARNSANSNTAR